MKRKLLSLTAALLCAIGSWADTVDCSDKMSNSTSNWTGVGSQTPINVCLTTGVETYQGNTTSFSTGDVLYQTITELSNGYYLVSFYAWENYANWEETDAIAYGDNIAQVFANTSVQDINVIKDKGGRDWNAANTYTLLATVTDGTLKYGVKNIASGGNWAACKAISLTYLGTCNTYLGTSDNADCTSLILNPSFETGNMSGWTTLRESNVENPGNLSDCGVKAVDDSYPLTNSDGDYIMNYYGHSWSWNENINGIQQTIPDLPEGKYRVETVLGGWNNWDIVLIVNDKTQTKRMTADNTGVSFSVDITLASATNLTITARTLHTGNNAWEPCFMKADNFRLYNLDHYYDALNEAIAAAEEKTLGFDIGEYTPYNNVAAITALNAAKAVNQENYDISWSELETIVSNLTSATWTANADEVNAVYNGMFDSDVEGDWGLTGWTRTNSWGQQQTGLSGAYATAYYNQPGSLKYGDTGNFTMPLKAETYYTLRVAYRSHEGNSTNVTVSVLKGEEGLPTKSLDWTSSTTDWTTQQVTFKTGTAGNYLLTLANYGNTWMTGVSLRRATVTEIKSILSDEITTANAIYASGANVGTGVFQYPSDAASTFNTAINTTAQGVYDNGSATVNDVVTAIDNLKAAEETYIASINAPADGKKYYIKVATSGHAKETNAIIIIPGSTSANNPTGYALNANFAPNTHLAQAVTFTQVSGNTYNISIETADGTAYLTYGTTNGSAAGWADSQIQATTDGSKKGEFKIVATSTDNVFNIINTITNTSVDCQDGGNIYTEGNNIGFTVAEAPQASVELAIAAGKLATRIFPFVPSLPEGVVAYSCNGNTDNSLTLEEVAEPAANVPYILYSESGCSSTDLTGWGIATVDTYTVGYLTGVFTRTKGLVGKYVLQTQGGKQAFYRVDDEDAYFSAYRVYVTVPAAGVKSFGFTLDDMETAIEAARAEGESTVTLRYNVAGQQMQNANKGLNIIKMADGSVHKVLVK